jgi:hypothetical protein
MMVTNRVNEENKWLSKFSPLMTFLCPNGRNTAKYKVNISKNDFNKE